MSYVAMLSGVIAYPREQPESPDEPSGLGDAISGVIESLQELSYLNSPIQDSNEFNVVTTQMGEEGDWVDILKIPTETHRNLGRNTDLLLEPATSGCVIATANEPSWHGAVDYADGRSIEVDLREWMGEGHAEEEPEESNYPTHDDWFDDQVDWQADVEAEFRAEKEAEDPFDSLAELFITAETLTVPN